MSEIPKQPVEHKRSLKNLVWRFTKKWSFQGSFLNQLALWSMGNLVWACLPHGVMATRFSWDCTPDGTWHCLIDMSAVVAYLNPSILFKLPLVGGTRFGLIWACLLSYRKSDANLASSVFFFGAANAEKVKFPWTSGPCNFLMSFNFISLSSSALNFSHGILPLGSIFFAKIRVSHFSGSRDCHLLMPCLNSHQAYLHDSLELCLIWVFRCKLDV